MSSRISNQLYFNPLHKTVILRACDFFDLSLVFAHPARVFELLHKTIILRGWDFLSMERPPTPQPACPTATVLSLQPPSPICHPDRRGGTCSSLHQQPIPAGSAALPIVILSEAPYKSIATKGFIARSRRTPAMRTIRCLRELSGRKLHRDGAEWRDLLFFPNSDSFVSNIFSATVH